MAKANRANESACKATAEWASRLLNRAPADQIPLYGSPSFDALPDDDPRKVASCVRAAEAWRRDGQPDAIGQRLIEEIEHNDRYTAWRIRMMSNEMSAALDWVAESYKPSWAELQARREYQEAG